MQPKLETEFALDRRWHFLRGEMEQSKKPALLLLARALAAAKLPYAIIGGVAVQVHQEEPRTTLDIDLAVLDRKGIPADDLSAAGFRRTGSFTHSENWLGPESTPVQFTDDPALAGAIARAGEVELDGVPLKVIGKADLLHEKLRAGRDPQPRKSKRLQDLGDAQALLEQNPGLAQDLTDAEQQQLAAAGL